MKSSHIIKAFLYKLISRLTKREILTAKIYPQYKIGRGTYGGVKVIAWGEGAKLIIGSFTSIASGVKILLGGEHRTDWVTTYPLGQMWSCEAHAPGHPVTKGDVVIGNDVWICTDALILSGVTIGDGAVIGAGAVISKDVEPYTIVSGNPQRKIRNRFSDEQVAILQNIAWWSWPDEKIQENAHLLQSNLIDEFISTHRENS